MHRGAPARGLSERVRPATARDRSARSRRARRRQPDPGDPDLRLLADPVARGRKPRPLPAADGVRPEASAPRRPRPGSRPRANHRRGGSRRRTVPPGRCSDARGERARLPSGHRAANAPVAGVASARQRGGLGRARGGRRAEQGLCGKGTVGSPGLRTLPVESSLELRAPLHPRHRGLILGAESRAFAGGARARRRERGSRGRGHFHPDRRPGAERRLSSTTKRPHSTRGPRLRSASATSAPGSSPRPGDRRQENGPDPSRIATDALAVTGGPLMPGGSSSAGGPRTTARDGRARDARSPP
jgi:hypothetical protein